MIVGQKHLKNGNRGDKNMNKKYDYIDCKQNENQYEDCDFTESKMVEARYVKALVDIDSGNPYIEALPYPRNEEAIEIDYTKTLSTYDYNKVKDMTKLEKLLQVGTLRQLRFPLTFHKNLEFTFYNSLLTSYRSRRQKGVKGKPIEYISENIEQETDCVLYGDSGDSTNAGFSLIGYSGCGKSSAISTLLSHYPQTIIHHEGDFKIYVQIVYFVVNCVPNSNFSALYEGIGEAIDKALENTKPLYAKEIAKTPTLGKKMEKIKNLIETFGIGVIIFDEIQLIDFDKTKDNTFESLMILANRTKVAIGVVGTEDARDKMFKELRTARRIGTVINGNMYCENKKFFTFLVKRLFQYQWFDEPVELTEDILDALFQNSKGIVDQMIGIFICMQSDYLERKKRPIINGQYVKDIAQRYYPGIQNVLAELESTEAARELITIRQEADTKISTIIDKAKQEKEADNLISKQEANHSREILLKNITTNILSIYDEYSIGDIENAFNFVIKKLKGERKTEREISRMVINKLSKIKTKKDIAEPTKSISHMKNCLE